MLGRFVVDAGRADGLPSDWELAVLSDADHPRASAIETKQVLDIPNRTYCEVPMELLPEVKHAGAKREIALRGPEHARDRGVHTAVRGIEASAEVYGWTARTADSRERAWVSECVCGGFSGVHRRGGD